LEWVNFTTVQRKKSRIPIMRQEKQDKQAEGGEIFQMTVTKVADKKEGGGLLSRL